MGKNIGTRVNLTLAPELVDVIDRIGVCIKKPRASVIKGWLIEGHPIWLEVAEALEAAKKNEAEGLRRVAGVLNITGSHAQQMSLDIKNTRRRLKRKNATT